MSTFLECKAVLECLTALECLTDLECQTALECLTDLECQTVLECQTNFKCQTVLECQTNFKCQKAQAAYFAQWTHVAVCHLIVHSPLAQQTLHTEHCTLYTAH